MGESRYIMQILGARNGSPTPFDGKYISGDYIPGFHDFGELETTSEFPEARLFPSQEEAIDFWRQEHPNGFGGLRRDGKPNRPLTYFNVEISSVSP